MKRTRKVRRKLKTYHRKKIMNHLVLKAGDHQYGKSNKKIDKRFRAMKPGKRISASGEVYYEYRRNRSDLHPAKHL